MPLAANQVLKYNGSRWTNAALAISELSDVVLDDTTPRELGSVNSSVSNGSVNRSTLQSNTLRTNAMTTDDSTTTVDLSSYTSNVYIHYTSSPLTISNGPDDLRGECVASNKEADGVEAIADGVVNPVTLSGGVIVQVDTDGAVFAQALYANNAFYHRYGLLSSMATIPWQKLYGG